MGQGKQVLYPDKKQEGNTSADGGNRQWRTLQTGNKDVGYRKLVNQKVKPSSLPLVLVVKVGWEDFGAAGSAGPRESTTDTLGVPRLVLPYPSLLFDDEKLGDRLCVPPLVPAGGFPKDPRQTQKQPHLVPPQHDPVFNVMRNPSASNCRHARAATPSCFALDTVILDMMVTTMMHASQHDVTCKQSL